MNKRTVGIIRRLYEADGDISLSSLAEEFQVSLRTIRNDLNAINDLLLKKNLTPLTLEKGGKVVCAEDFSEIIKSVETTDYYSYKLSREERVELAARQRKNPVTEQDEENEEILKKLLKKLLIEQEHVYKSFLTDDSFWKILVYLEIMIRRNNILKCEKRIPTANLKWQQISCDIRDSTVIFPQRRMKVSS